MTVTVSQDTARDRRESPLATLRHRSWQFPGIGLYPAYLACLPRYSVKKGKHYWPRFEPGAFNFDTFLTR